MSTTSYNRTIRGALNGKVAEFVTFPVPWVLADDVASVCVAAAVQGATGRTYLAFGAEDAQSTAAFLNVALDVAGAEHRVAELSIAGDDPAAVARFGETLVDLAQRTFPVPWFDNGGTRAELGYEPTPLRTGLETTIEWLRANGQVG